MFFGKRKCGVCGHRFKLERERVYTATEPKGLFEGITTPAKIYDATDCPRCGCQIALMVRLPKVNTETGQPEDAEVERDE